MIHLHKEVYRLPAALHRLALLQPRRGGSIGIVAISDQATGAPAFAAASSGGTLGSQCTARKRRPVTPPAASDTSQLSGGAITAGWSSRRDRSRPRAVYHAGIGDPAHKTDSRPGSLPALPH